MSPKAPISLAWKLVGDLLATRVSVGEIKHVRFFLRLFGYFFKSSVGLGDVATTKYVFEEEDVSAKSYDKS